MNRGFLFFPLPGVHWRHPKTEKISADCPGRLKKSGKNGQCKDIWYNMIQNIRHDNFVFPENMPLFQKLEFFPQATDNLRKKIGKNILFCAKKPDRTTRLFKRKKIAIIYGNTRGKLTAPKNGKKYFGGKFCEKSRIPQVFDGT